MKAWIETTGGDRIELGANCYLGRSSSNSVHLKSVAASRRHAHIHAQEADHGTEYWIADLGSTNGTLRNGKRITIPCRLRDGDKIDILEDAFTFRLEEAPALATMESNAPFTVPVRAKQLVWFLMLDIKRYTILSRQLDTDTLSLKVGTWLRQARDVIEPAGGVVDKFLGDAIFAYWKEDALAPMRVSESLQKLLQMQAAKDPDFRIVLHHGAAVVSGGAGGADNLSGPEVISVFRMEKVCSGLGNDSIVSEAARAALPATCPTEPVGSHPLDGFPGTHVMHRLAQTS